MNNRVTHDRRERLERLSPSKRSLLIKALRDKTAQAAQRQRIPRRQENLAPLSFAQQRLWFLHQMEPASSVYNIPTALRLSGELDVNALGRSLNALIARHEVLRTAFVAEDGRPLQIPALTLYLELPLVDLTTLPPGSRETEAQRLAIEAARRPFDLARAPLLRALLVRLDRCEHFASLTVHHIVSDAWSKGVLVRDLTELYRGQISGEPAGLTPLPIQYADFSVWQRGWLEGGELERQLAYWRERLSPEPPVLELPTDQPRPSVQSFRGQIHAFALSDLGTVQLQDLARREAVTLFMAALAAFQALLGRYSNQDDITVGSVVAGRNRAETADLIGFFVNTLVLRTGLAGAPSFRELLQRVRQVVVGATDHQDLPFEKLVDELRPRRDLSRTPLFQVMFLLQNESREQHYLAGLSIGPVELPATTAKFDLTLSVIERKGRLLASFSYATDLFERTTIARMAGHFETLLAAAAADPDQRAAEVPLFTGPERQQILREWRETPADLPAVCVHEVVALRAAERRGAVAVTCGEESLTYGELEARANRLAQHLVALGVGPEVVVGLFLERSLQVVIGALAILKAGGAYLPLDPDYPTERLAFILEDARCPVVITNETLASALPQGSAYRLLLRAEAERIAQRRTEPPRSGVSPENAAYVIYTSGTTGRPKGVIIPHSNVFRLISAADLSFSFAVDEVWTVFHSFAFDYSVWELWGALTTGGRAALVDYWTARSPEAFRSMLERERVTILSQTPSAFRQLIAADAAAGEAQDLALRSIVFAGEVLEPQILQTWIDRHGNEKPGLVNMYGITETTVHTTYRLVVADDLRSAASPIGRPLPGWRIHLLDRAGQPVPAGVCGEIYVGGVGLARGYLGRPALTAERFVPDPFGEHGERLYRSGDLARYRPDGQLESLGRLDDQVKIRGFRIELGEVGAVLLEHPEIRDMVVVARSEGGGPKRLVAYLVPRALPGPTVAELRAFAATRLPDYMVPSTFVSLPAFPLTTNGKVDRRALPAPEPARPDQARAHTPPRTPVERSLAAVWSEVLRVERVGIHDNFFELGGDSILSIQIVSRSARAGIHITPKQIFQHQTIAELAAVAGAALAVAAEQGPVVGELPLTPIQAWFFELELAEPHHHNQSFFFQVDARWTPALLERAAAALLLHHDALRLRFTLGAAGWRAAIALPDHSSPVAMIDLAALPQPVRQGELEHAAAAIQASLDLETGPLARFVYFRLEPPEPARLLLAIHHLAVDGVSWRILLGDLETALGQLRSTGEIRLPAKTTSYRAWAQRLRDHAGAGGFDHELGFWLDAPRLSVPRLPIDLPDGGNQAGSVRTVLVALEPEETSALLQEVPKAYRTQINDALLTALALACAGWTGSRRLLVDLEGHGREELFEDVDLSRTVGWFTTVFPVLLDLGGADDPGRALKAVKEQVRSVPGRGIGYSALRYLAAPETAGRLAGLPPAEISFNYLGQLDQALDPDSPLVPARESRGPLQSPRQLRRHLLDVSGRVQGGRLYLSCAYSEELHQRATIERLVHAFRDELRQLIAHCLAPEAGGYTPSDFPLARLDQAALDRLAVGRGEIEDIYPLSPLQQGLLFHTLHAADSSSYRQQLSCLFQGELDLGAFREAWQRVLDRHPILRTSFAWDGLDRPLQVVHQRVEAHLEQEDWSHLGTAEQRRRLEEFLSADRSRGFDLGQAPLMRLGLFKTASDAHRFVWSFHHILWDGWSFPALIGEVFGLYQARVEGREPELPRRRRYRDYIEWLEAQDLAAAESYWRGALAGFAAPTPLTVSRIPPQPAAATDSQIRELLPAPVTTALQARARRDQLTLNTLVQGAWSLLIGRYSGEPDVVFGAVSSGRSLPLPDIEQMVGLFINTLPVRVRMAPEERLTGWLQALQASQIEARQFEYSPLAQVQGWSEVPRGQPLFESILAFENFPVDETMRSAGRGKVGIAEVRFVESTNYPIAVMATPGAQLAVRILYDSQVFDRPASARLLHHLHNLLGQIAEETDRSLRDFHLLAPAECHQLVVEWNDTAAPYTDQALLHQPFERWAARTPEARALSFEEEEISYGELNRQANRLARRLRASGVGPGQPVGILLGRSAAMVVALLGIAKSGGSYVPLDPALPAARMRWILGSLGATCLVTRSAHLAEIGEVLADLPVLAEVICLDDEAPPVEGPRVWTRGDLESLGDGDLPPLATAEDTAYIIFTSGSTGTPKGVVVRHRPVSNLIEWVNRTFRMQPTDRVLFITSLSFDLSVYDVFGILAAGGSIRVASSADLREPRRLVHLLETDCVTFWDSAPAALLQLVPFFPSTPSATSALRLVFFSGDWIPVSLPVRVRASFPAAEVVGLGGATEATIWSNFHRTGEPDPRWVSVPYGRPIQNARYHVLDERLEPCPIGVPGDLYIGGDCLAAGYAGEPLLTARQFVPDPWGEARGVLYHTGDRARYWPDGQIEFLGRLDQQVKIRGFRIELGEIEASLSELPGARDAVVLAREDEPGHKRLVAYLVAAPGETPNVSELRELLAARLPEYMVPSAFVVLDALPVTANGKLDRKALPAPGIERPALASEFAAPGTPAEKILSEIWASVLPVKQIGIHDNFFELGGDSILSLQIVSRASRSGLKLTTAQVFEHQTIAELAAVAGTESEAEAVQDAVIGPAPLTPIQYWFFAPEPPDPHHFNLTLLLEIAAPPPLWALARATAFLLEHHDALRLRFTRGKEGWRQTHAAPGGEPPVSCLDLSALAFEAQRSELERAAARLQASLDLAQGPLLRIALLTLGAAQPARLLVVAHHLVVDGVSLRILLEDLAASTEQIAARRKPELPLKTTSFQRWAERLAEAGRSSDVRAQLAYWTGPSRAQVPVLPVDFALLPDRADTQRALTVALDAEQTTLLLQQVPRAYRTQINDALLTALVEALAPWTGSHRLLLDLEGHGRESPFVTGLDVSRTVGWFTALYPVLLDPGAGAGPGQALKAVKEQLREIPDRGLGYGLLRYLGEPEDRERMRAMPQAEVSFNYLGQLDQGLPEQTPYRWAQEATGSSQSPRRERRYLLEVDCRVLGGRLLATWRYGANRHQRETVERLARRFLTALQELIEHCLAPDARGHTPSDFPLARITQAALDRLEAAQGEIEDLYPLSPLQRGLLFHTLQAPDSGVYVQQLTALLEGDLDAAAFERAWQRLVDRHSILRTAFVWEGLDEPLQAVRAEAPVSLEQLDHRGLAPEEQARRFAACVRQDMMRGLDPSRAPLLRLTLARTGEREHRFLWTHHHLLLDGWSLPLLIGELFAFYEAFARGEDLTLEKPRPFRDYIAWLLAQDRTRAETFWRGYLEGFAAPTVIDGRHGARTDSRSQPESRDELLALSESTTAALLALAHRSQLTPNTLFQGAWALLLGRYSGGADVVFGTVSSGRPAELAGVESMLGLFLATTPARARIANRELLLPWLRRLQAEQVEARQYEYSSLVEIQGWSEVPRHEVLFESLFLFENYPVADTVGQRRPNLAVREAQMDERTNYPLNLTALPGRRLRLLLSYDARRFDRETPVRILHGLEALLTGMVEEPERPLEDLPILSASERHQVLVEWNDTAAPFPAGETIATLFARRAADAPEALAVVQGGSALSYGEVAVRAHRLAQRLRVRGVGPEARVGLYLERVPELAVALLGVLAAGGAYLPLDPAAPVERLAYMLADSDARIVLTLSRLRPLLGELAGVELLDLDAEEQGAVAAADSVSQFRAEPEGLAYVIYTSGSTGQPKAALVSHRSLVNHSTNAVRAYGLTVADRVLQFSSLGFDMLAEDLFPTWLAGATVVMPPNLEALNPSTFSRFIESAGLTVLNLPTAYWSEWTAELRASGEPLPPSLRLIVGGSDRVPPEQAAEWERLTGGRLAWRNAYGVTEATIAAAIYRPRTRGGVEQPSSVPIGRPISNFGLYVVDRSLDPVPLGAAGELLIGGSGVARGYCGRPDLTAERFIPDAFGEESGARLYRTGDLVRYLPDGNIEFLGRIDFQVKVRGFRIETGEIEAILGLLPEVRHAVVELRTGKRRDARLVAYLVPSDKSIDEAEVRAFLRHKLPEYMVPSAFVVLDALPVTVNGKVDRRALPEPEIAPESAARSSAPRNEIERRIAAVWQEVLEVENIGVEDSFFDLGGNSLLLMKAHSRLSERFDGGLALVDLFRFPTIRALAEHLRPQPGRADRAGQGRARAALRQQVGLQAAEAVAIIGMDCRFPGANGVEQFWRNLRDGVESITFFSDEELRAAGVDPALLDDPAYVKAKAIVEGIDLFDAEFFGFNPREAEILDPQQRLFLECAWNAVESAGYDIASYPGSVGVFAGASESTYLQNLHSQPELLRSFGAYQLGLANDRDFVPTRVSYKLNLNGPSLSVNTACSTSLVTVHLACQHLLSGACDMALAGGVSITVPQTSGYLYQEGGILSPDGHCRSFDAGSSGTLDGNGVGVVLLKRLSDALADGDTIRAVVRGSAINNDGSRKVGFTAPSVEGQAAVIAEALAVAGVDPNTIEYVEAHGTGTPLGDPLEIAALAEAFGRMAEEGRVCAIGSVKSNIGHLDVAAGVAGLIKAVLALEKREIPPSLHFERPNPEIGLDATPFRVQQRLSDWPANGFPRRAGVSSFGLGGTNAHLILEEALAAASTVSPRPWELLVLSARTEAALEAATDNLARHLTEHPELAAGDVAFTLQAGRQAFPWRRAVVCGDLAMAAELLRRREPGQVFTGQVESGARSVVFMLPGQGSHHPGMGEELYSREPGFRADVDRCADLLVPHLGFDLRELLFPAPDRLDEAASRLEQTAYAQPALFVTEYAVARLWMSWGVEPQALIGHSLGEYVAACLSGVFSIEDALRLVALRGRMIQELPGGAMLSIELSAEEIAPFLRGGLEIAALNAPSLTVVSGPDPEVLELQRQLGESGIEHRRLRTSHAFHSAVVEPILDRFAREVSRLRLGEPRIPWISNVSGTWIDADRATDPRYWAEHLRAPVRFAEGLQELLSASERVFLEVGPGRALTTMLRQQPEGASRTALTSLNPVGERRAGPPAAVEALGRLWLAGVQVNWQGLHRGRSPRRVPLPTYPFERQRYWIEKRQHTLGRLSRAHRQKDLADWFHAPTWRRTAPARALARQESSEEVWLFFADQAGLAAGLARRLESAGAQAVLVTVGDGFGITKGDYTFDPERPQDYEVLFEDLERRGLRPRRIVHLWTAQAECEKPLLDLGFHSLLELARALGRRDLGALEIIVLSARMFQVTGEEVLEPERSLVLGPCRVIPREYPGLSCRVIELAAGLERDVPPASLDALAAELSLATPEPAVAYRGAHRWVQGFDPVRVEAGAAASARIREGGIYLVTGGLGGIGLTLAERLASAAARVKLVLTSRSAFPAQETWHRILAEGGEERLVRQISALRELEGHGAEILVLQADSADRKQMEEVRRRAIERFGAIHGIVHAAGVPGSGPIQLATREAAAQVLAPKVEGTRILADLFGGPDLDFLVLCSSMDSILGGFGQADYCAGNSFLDAFAHSSRAAAFTVSINWDAWRGVGMAVEAYRRSHRPGQEKEGLKNAISPQEGAEAFARVLGGWHLPQAVVSTHDLRAVILRELEAAARRGEKPRKAEQGHARPFSDSTYAAPRNEIEHTIAAIWQELLGIERIGIHDNFFELRGHSLLATRVLTRVRETLQTDVTVAEMFEAPTVAGLAEIILARKVAQAEDLDLAGLLDELEGMSDEDLAALTEAEKGEPAA